jgi:hypothetical protein
MNRWWPATLAGALALAACGGSGSSAPPTPTVSVHVHVHPGSTGNPGTQTTPTGATGAGSAPLPKPKPPPKLIAIRPGAHRQGLFGWIPAAAVRGVPAVSISRVAAFGVPGQSVTLVRFDQHLVTLTLHAGGSQPGGSGWRPGDSIHARERHYLLAAFNSAFQESYGGGGFVQNGRVGWPLKRGYASVVMYTTGLADIGAWRHGVPAPGQPVAAVRQNLHLLVDNGLIPANVDSCIKRCWGDPLHEQPVVARSALGITADGQLVWAAGGQLSVRALADALQGAGAVRAMELDINLAWVAGFLYFHPPHSHTVVPLALMPGQTTVDSAFLAPYYRDFFTILAN